MRFCFYDELKDFKGGHITLIINLIKGLHYHGQEVVLINYKDGLIAGELSLSGIKIEIIEITDLNKGNAGSYIRSSDILIITAFCGDMRFLFKGNPRIIYYDIADFICRISDYRGIKLPFLGKMFLRKLLASDSLIFMDDTGPESLKREYGIMIDNPRFLPIPVPDEEKNIYVEESRDLDKNVNLTYIGRAVDWKMYPLKKIIEDATEANESITFHIVVDSISSFKKFIDINEYQDSRLTFKIYENLRPSEIKPFLIKHADLNFGMGTAALHGAAIGIPTILMDYSTKHFPGDYSYRWLHESKHFSLGKNIEKVPIPKGIELKDVLSLARTRSEREKLSSDSFQYVTNYHSLSAVVAKLILFGEQCKFRLKSAKNFYPYFFKLHLIAKKILSPITRVR